MGSLETNKTTKPYPAELRERAARLVREQAEHGSQWSAIRSSAVEARGAASSPSSSPPFEWMDWFNQRRILEPIGDIPPAEAETLFYAELETRAVAA